jgi:serine phosphatase RsbU (regulator of sigma subunit)
VVNGIALAGGAEHLLKENDRIKICDVEFIYHAASPPRTKDPERAVDLMVITESDGKEAPDFRTLEASRSSTMASAVRPEVKLKAILEITRSLSNELRIDTVAPKILDSLMEIFPGAERLFLMLQDPSSKRLVRKAFKYRPQKRTSFIRNVPEDEAPTSISRTIVDHVLGQKKAVLSQDAGEDKNLPSSASISDLKIRSVMCVPLLTPDNKALGIIQLDTSDRRQFNEDDLDVLAAVASQAAISIQNASMLESLLERERLNRDLKLAEQVQKRFLPQGVPSVPGYEFFAHYQATYEVGGDYYDFVPLAADRMAVALGDVSGKGVAAALIMAKFSGDTRYCILTENAPAPTATRLNSLFCAAAIEDKFITLSLCVLDAPSRKLTLTSAGHTPVLIRRADGRVEEIGQEVSGVPLGVMDDSVYQETEVQLNQGDVVVIYSDGVTDARSPGDELYDSQNNHRLVKRVAQASGGPAAVGRAILQDIREFSAGHSQADDITLVCLGPTAG